MAGQDNNKCNGDENVTNGVIDPTPNDDNDTNIREEYDFLDSKLDQLNSALDQLEQKNDDIHAQLKELLQSNIDIREELRNQNQLSQQQQ